jgi:Ion channel
MWCRQLAERLPIVAWYGFGCLVSVSLSLKLLEMLTHCYQALRLHFERDNRTWAPWSPTAWLVTGPVLRLPLGKGARLLLLGLFFRWTTLMLMEGVIAATASSRWIILCTSALLIAGVWTEVLQRFIFRFQFGHGDTQLRISAERDLENQVIFNNRQHGSPRFTVMHDFVLLFARLFGVTTLSYAAIYCGLRNLLPQCETFHGVSSGAESIVDLVYFSIVTAATVGYGDIYPTNPWAKLMVVSEIFCIFSLFVLLLSAFSLTGTTVPPGPNKGGDAS